MQQRQSEFFLLSFLIYSTTFLLECDAFSLDMWLKVIDCIDLPILKIHMIEALLTKMDGKLVVLNPKTIHANLKLLEKDFDDYFNCSDDENNDKDMNLNNILTKRNTNTYDHVEHLQHPVLRKTRRHASYDMKHQKHTELFFIAFDAYEKTFHLKHAQAVMKNTQTTNQINQIGQHNELSRQTKNIKVQASSEKALAKFMKKPYLELIKDAGQNGYYNQNVSTNNHKSKGPIPVFANFTRLREDIKYYELVTNELPKLNVQFNYLLSKLN